MVVIENSEKNIVRCNEKKFQVAINDNIKIVDLPYRQPSS